MWTSASGTLGIAGLAAWSVTGALVFLVAGLAFLLLLSLVVLSPSPSR
ncbi:hypothetical protein LY13_004701 [Prauserella aidingensis]|nr:hypothetical protein [Prauserella aidingensis]MCP2255919.1 hypothetical protein [Prauserella aidingensis]